MTTTTSTRHLGKRHVDPVVAEVARCSRHERRDHRDCRDRRCDRYAEAQTRTQVGTSEYEFVTLQAAQQPDRDDSHSNQSVREEVCVADLYYDPDDFDFDIDADPYPVWQRMRDEQPLVLQRQTRLLRAHAVG